MGAVASRYRVYNSGLAPTDIKKLENENKRENPGTLDELHKKTKGESCGHQKMFLSHLTKLKKVLALSEHIINVSSFRKNR